MGRVAAAWARLSRKNKIIVGSVGTFAFLWVVGVGLSEPEDQQPSPGKVSQADFGEEWPFTVPDGTLACEKGMAYTFTHEGAVYALNGMADSWAEVFGYADLDPIWKPDLTPVAWPTSVPIDGPVPTGWDYFGKRMSLAPFFDLAYQLC